MAEVAVGVVGASHVVFPGSQGAEKVAAEGSVDSAAVGEPSPALRAASVVDVGVAFKLDGGVVLPFAERKPKTITQQGQIHDQCPTAIPFALGGMRVAR